jgi:hypothetical protein
MTDPTHHTQTINTDWRHHSACRGTDPELFFPVATSGLAHQAQVQRAKAVCSGCPVREQCLAWALEALPHGIAGGLTETERQQLRHRQCLRSRRRPEPSRPIAASAGEIARAGREALRAGRSVAEVAGEFQVSDRTVYRWARTLTSTSSAGAR